MSPADVKPLIPAYERDLLAAAERVVEAAAARDKAGRALESARAPGPMLARAAEDAETVWHEALHDYWCASERAAGRDPYRRPR